MLNQFHPAYDDRLLLKRRYLKAADSGTHIQYRLSIQIRNYYSKIHSTNKTNWFVSVIEIHAFGISKFSSVRQKRAHFIVRKMFFFLLNLCYFSVPTNDFHQYNIRNCTRVSYYLGAVVGASFAKIIVLNTVRKMFIVMSDIMIV